MGDLNNRAGREVPWHTTPGGGAHVNLRDENGFEITNIGGQNVAREYDTIAMVAAGANYDTFDLSPYDEIQFDVTNANSPLVDSVTVHQSRDGTNFGPAEKPFDQATQQAASGTTFQNGSYRLPINCRYVRFTKTGSTDAMTVNWSAKTTNRVAG